jgi:DNA-binding Lrp family transcriptional regulator
MRNFFVFIKCELGRAYEVADHIAWNLDPNPYIYSISGEFDLIAHFQVGEDLDIGRFINGKLHEVPGIRDTQTLIAFNTFSKDAGFPFDDGGAPARD